MAERKGLMARAGKALKAALDMGPPAGVLTPPTDPQPDAEPEQRANVSMTEWATEARQRQMLIDWFERRFRCAYGPESGRNLQYATFALQTPLNEGCWARLGAAMVHRFSTIPEGAECFWRLPYKLDMVGNLESSMAVVTFRASFVDADISGAPSVGQGQAPELI